MKCGNTHKGGAKTIRPRGPAGSRVRLCKAQPVVLDCTMIDWDDVRYFLAVAREGSVRAAAGRLGVNHSTVLRRITRLNLHGRKGPELFGGVYISRDRLAAWRAGAPDPIRWIVISMHGVPDWASEGEISTTGVPFRTTDADAQIAAVRQGLGVTTLPCFMGDTDPLLARVPATDLHMYGTLWLLTQGETRKTKRVQLFTEFVSRRLDTYAPLLAGLTDLFKQRVGHSPSGSQVGAHRCGAAVENRSHSSSLIASCRFTVSGCRLACCEFDDFGGDLFLPDPALGRL